VHWGAPERNARASVVESAGMRSILAPRMSVGNVRAICGAKQIQSGESVGSQWAARSTGDKASLRVAKRKCLPWAKAVPSAHAAVKDHDRFAACFARP
jgi:hypothetical protein